MQRKLYILLVVVTCFFGSIPKAFAQSPPVRQLIGGKAVFAVDGDKFFDNLPKLIDIPPEAKPTFRYSITGGVFLDTTRHDSLVVEWGLVQGMYQICAQEIAWGGCEGEWTCIDIELLKMSILENAEMTLCPGDTLRLPTVNPDLFKNVRWSDAKAVERGIVQPGEYQVWAENEDGEQVTEILTVTICERPPLIKAPPQPADRKLLQPPIQLSP